MLIPLATMASVINIYLFKNLISENVFWISKILAH